MGNSYDIWLSAAVGTVSHINHLLERFGDAEGVFRAREKDITEDEILSSNEKGFLTSPEKEENRSSRYDYVCRNDIRMICRHEKDYPKRFGCLDDPPYGIFVQGKLPPPEVPAIAVVGSRRASTYGENVTEQFAGELAAAGIIIVSGLAMGIDGISHRAALENGGFTVGVLGSGIGVPYPKENWKLYQQMREKGCVLSEHGPGVPPMKHNFPHRNRLISALADGILVVEAAERSGTLITVDRGLEQGKDIFAVPGRIGDRNSEGCLNLIRQGAFLVTKPEQIIAELASNFPSVKKNCGAFQQLSLNFSNDFDEFNENSENLILGIARDEKVVYDLCRLDARHFDELLSQSGLTVARLSEVLYSLQQKGIVRQAIPNYYSRKG
ncbi:MAG: DNA-processing protein DprA [Lachnospiraceae bacterium]|nr:DNA-processing protein DprA [Lachnospiraceae bacterium]